MTPQIHLYILASGSKGNAAVIAGPNGSLLVDCGISRKQLRLRADEVGCDLGRVSAILVTHEHGDHTSGLSVICKHFDGPIFATAGTVAGRKHLSALPFTLIDHDETLELCGMRVRAFPTSHDVNDPMCFRFEVRGKTEVDDNGVMDAVPGAVWFIGKTFFVIFLLMWERWTFPRLRIDHILSLEWKYLMPISLINLLLMALVVVFGLGINV